MQGGDAVECAWDGLHPSSPPWRCDDFRPFSIPVGAPAGGVMSGADLRAKGVLVGTDLRKQGGKFVATEALARNSVALHRRRRKCQEKAVEIATACRSDQQFLLMDVSEFRRYAFH